MMFCIRSDRILVGDGIFDGYVYVQDGTIVEVTRAELAADATYDFSGKYVSAGFIDMHTHGGGGHPFMGGSPQEVIDGCAFHLRHGTTSIVPTISAGPFDVMRAAVADIAAAKRSGRSVSNILGAHLEGPYLSAAQCGAQCLSYIMPPKKTQYAALLEEYGADIVRWTYAPEYDAHGAFCRYLTDRGVLASAGHTDATYADMATAIDNGCKLVTHLYSCTSTVTRDHGFRHLGVIESAFLRDELHVEIIADGKHLPPELIRMIVKIKGADKVALITDSLAIAGTDATQGEMSGTAYIVEDGVCKLRDRSAFAGSVASADRLVRVLTKDCGMPIATAVKMLTQTPADLLGCKKGRIACGYDADIIVFDDDVRVLDIFVGGKKLQSHGGLI